MNWKIACIEELNLSQESENKIYESKIYVRKKIVFMAIVDKTEEV